MVQHEPIMVIGAGLAGSEAALQIAHAGIRVELFEMRPALSTPAHRTDHFAELVCSNSFGSDSQNTASWILKRELGWLGSFLLQIAREVRVPAGQSLALDRKLFSEAVTEQIRRSPLITVYREEATSIPRGRIAVIASGPLTSDAFAGWLSGRLGEKSLYFYDAISPIVSADSLDFDKMFAQSRYDKGPADFWNAPLTREQYDRFVEDLLSAQAILPYVFEERRYFDACMPIEVLAARGSQTLAFGPMKPVGLLDPHTQKRPYAVVQLRSENQHRTAYNIVGFQTKLTYADQQRLFRTIPGLERAEFLRLGSMHRNSYLDSPKLLLPTLQLRSDEALFVGGQLTGTEGYVESIMTGLIAGINAARLRQARPPIHPPADTMSGALLGAITNDRPQAFQPINSNFGILPPCDTRHKNKQERNYRLSKRAEESFKTWQRQIMVNQGDCKETST